MIKDYFEVPDVEHQGDIDHFIGIIQDAGGEILKVNWSGEEDVQPYLARCITMLYQNTFMGH